MYICLCVAICIVTHTYIYILCVYIYTHVCMHVHVHVNVCKTVRFGYITFVYMYVRVCACIYVYIYIYIIHMYIYYVYCIHTRMRSPPGTKYCCRSIVGAVVSTIDSAIIHHRLCDDDPETSVCEFSGRLGRINTSVHVLCIWHMVLYCAIL